MRRNPRRTESFVGLRCSQEDGSVVSSSNRSRSSRCMHTIWCLLVSAGVPRMRLCSSLSVVATFYLLLIFSGGVACGCVHEGAGVSRRRCGFDHVCMGVRVSGCAGVWVCLCLLFFSVHTCLSLTVPTTRCTAPFALVAAQHDRIPSQTFSENWTFCASVMCRGAALDTIEIPEYVSTLQGEGTLDRYCGRRGSMSFEPWSVRCLLLTALPSRGMCSRTFASWSLPRVSLSLSSAVFRHTVGTRARVQSTSSCVRCT